MLVLQCEKALHHHHHQFYVTLTNTVINIMTTIIFSIETTTTVWFAVFAEVQHAVLSSFADQAGKLRESEA